MLDKFGEIIDKVNTKFEGIDAWIFEKANIKVKTGTVVFGIVFGIILIIIVKIVLGIIGHALMTGEY